MLFQYVIEEGSNWEIGLHGTSDILMIIFNTFTSESYGGVVDMVYIGGGVQKFQSQP